MANCRWLSRGAVLDSATKNINAIYDLSVEVAAKKSGRKDDDDDDDEDGGDVGDGGDASAKRLGPKDIVERLGDFKYVASIFFLSDLIGLVNTVTTTFQQSIMESAVVAVKRQVGAEPHLEQLHAGEESLGSQDEEVPLRNQGRPRGHGRPW